MGKLPAYVRFKMRDHTYTATVHSVKDLDRWCHENHSEIVSFSIEQTGSINPDSIRDAVLKTHCLRCVADNDRWYWKGGTEQIHTP